jgi:hypothetical protein
MGLGMMPLGKPRAGLEEFYNELLYKIQNYKPSQLSFLDKLLGKKHQSMEELLQEWHRIQEPAYETIKAPRVGRDEEANNWLKELYLQSDKKQISELSKSSFI